MRHSIVTPSYGPDFQRCRLLCQSIDQFVEGPFHHHIIVDKRDYRLFRQLENSRTSILTVESVMPWWLRRAPWARRWWLSFKTMPVRNWVLQQLVKLSVGEFIKDTDSYVFIDSDVVFIRPFDVSDLLQNSRLRLFRVPGAAQLPSHARWHRTAAHLLGLPETDYFGSTYIGNLITWRRDALLRMYRHIETIHEKPWLQAVASQWHLSEYILYGVFVEHVLAPVADTGHEYTDIPLAHISWDYSIQSDRDLERFFSEVHPHHVAVMVSSKQHIDVDRYEHLLKAVPAIGSLATHGS